MPQIHTHCPQIRWSDLDLNGHVNNARILTLLEESRILFNEFAGEDVLAGPKVVGRIEIDYRKPIMYGSELRIDSAVTRIGTTSYTLESVGTQNGAPVFESKVVLVLLDEDERPRPLTERDREYLSSFAGELPAHTAA